ncbi:MAG: DUF4129 domain-containing protein [Sphingomonas sp.]
MTGATVQQAAREAQRFAAAHRALRADATIQFRMERAPEPSPPPQWLIDFFGWLGRVFAPVGRLMNWLNSLIPDWPFARFFFWAMLGTLALLVLWLAFQRIRHGTWRRPRRRIAPAAAADPDGEAWVPDAVPVRAWLAEADALAATGRFAEAAHLLLLRSVEDIARRRPRLVRPALTSRELADADAVPQAARTLFADIAMLVETSLFGGRPVDRDDWHSARTAYADFALPGAWRP